MNSVPPSWARVEHARRKVVWGLIAAGLGVLGLHVAIAPPSWKELIPATTYNVVLEMKLEGYGDRVRVSTYLPATDERQLVTEESVKQGSLLYSTSDRAEGRVGRWIGDRVTGPQAIAYTARIVPQGVRYDLPADLPLPARPQPPRMRPHLEATETIQVTHPEVAALWDKIRPRRATTETTLRAIYDFVYARIDGAEFKGTTDALTALRLRQGSCNGKSRLFAALARHAGLPTRLVGGLILEPGTKRTSHQWVEVHTGGRWVPFCPTNGYFAELPQNYLLLYRGDHALFTRTKDIAFDYQFSIDRRLEPGSGLHFAAATGDPTGVDRGVAGLFGIGRGVSRIFLMFPIAALIVVVFKNVVGLQSLGVFLPMLIAAACRHTGLWVGLGAFVVVVALAALVSHGMNRLQILQGPRLSVLITAVTLSVVLAVALFPDSLGSRLALLGLFPSVILGFTGERLNKMAADRSWSELLTVVASTAALIVVCYAAIGSIVLQTLLVGFPELLLLVIAAQMGVGRWTGLRLSEYVRFERLFPRSGGGGEGQVLGINARNLEVLERLNRADLIAIADDKLQTKQALVARGVPTPENLAVVRNTRDLQGSELALALASCDEFVIKPGCGSAGNGVLVICSRDGGFFLGADGQTYAQADLRRHLSEILAGIFSDGRPDQAIVEERIRPHAFFEELSRHGLSDLRILMVHGRPLAAMLRLPTGESGGRANLHQGAIGTPVSLEAGVTGPGYLRRVPVERAPDTGARLGGRQVPCWPEVLRVAREAHRAIPLGYIGLDICIDERRGPLVLEVNARPGLEIQNVQGCGLRAEIGQLVEQA